MCVCSDLACPRLPPDSRGVAFREDGGSDADRGFDELDFKDSPVDRRPVDMSADPPRSAPPETLRVLEGARTPSPRSKERPCGTTQGPNVAPKPKLWSLAEIATSSDKSKGCSDSQSVGAGQQRTPFPHGPALPRHFYYTSPFIPGYSAYGPPGPLHGGASSLNGLLQTAARDRRLRCQSQLEPHEHSRGTANV